MAFFWSLFALTSLFATKIDPHFVSEMEPQELTYKSNHIIGDRFKIQLNDGVIFDACACGCKKDAAASLAKWSHGDAIEIYPYAEDAKGFIYLLRNLENNTEVYSWVKTDLPKSVNLPTIKAWGKLPNTCITSDDHQWLFTAGQNIDEWKTGDRILICKNAYLKPSEFLLINFDSPGNRHIKAFHIPRLTHVR
ncbi:MAG: hypothetical protein KDK44_03615 [Chlamydiia bacterium]|nr:hypothetical protein [Chlamydiia bacterium]